jgi:hypothetical protein
MPAGIYDMTIEQGATFALNLTLQDADGDPFDLTGYTGRAQLRVRYSDASPLVSFTVTVPQVGTLATEGKLSVGLTATQTANLPPRALVYDLELVKNADVIRILQGRAEVSPEVTR